MSMGGAHPELTLLYWITLISVAAILGNFLGYACGKYFAQRLMATKDIWLFKKENIHKAQEFYDKRGGGAYILARFLLIVRTFAPIVAGIVKMDCKQLAYNNSVVPFVWVGSLMTLGYLLGENPWVQRRFEFVLAGIVIAATVPVIIKVTKGK